MQDRYLSNTNSSPSARACRIQHGCGAAECRCRHCHGILAELQDIDFCATIIWDPPLPLVQFLCTGPNGGSACPTQALLAGNVERCLGRSHADMQRVVTTQMDVSSIHITVTVTVTLRLTVAGGMGR